MKYAYSIRTTSELISVLLRHNFNYIDSNVSGISYKLKLKKEFFFGIFAWCTIQWVNRLLQQN